MDEIPKNETRETETEPQGFNPERHFSKKRMWPKYRKWHCRDEEVPPNVGTLKRSKNKPVVREFKGSEPWERHYLRGINALQHGGGEDQAWGHRERAKGEPLKGRRIMCGQTRSRWCWSSQNIKGNQRRWKGPGR